MDKPMTLKDARESLSGRLVFGDERLIEAVRIIKAAGDLIRLSKDGRECPECDGEGMIECCECGHERDCEECDGKGKLTWTENDLQRSTLREIQAHLKDIKELVTA